MKIIAMLSLIPASLAWVIVGVLFALTAVVSCAIVKLVITEVRERIAERDDDDDM